MITVILKLVTFNNTQNILCTLYILTAIKNAKVAFLLITFVFSNIFRQNEFYLEEKSFLNKLTTFCIILVDYFIFKIQKQNLGRKAKVAGFFTMQSAG